MTTAPKKATPKAGTARRDYDRRKKRALLRASRAYLAQLVERPLTIRFDIVEIDHVDGARTALRHFANVPLFPKELRPRR